MPVESNTVQSLDKDIKDRMNAKFSPERANQAKEWVELILDEKIPAFDHATLKDGTILVKLLNKVEPGACKVQVSTMPFKQMENINNFLKGAEKIGCPKMELFQTIDLFENKNFMQVIDTIFSFSRHAHDKNSELPLLGPKLTMKRDVSFTSEQMNAGKYIPRLQTGFAGGASQAGMGAFGTRRQVTDSASTGAPTIPSPQSNEEANEAK